MKRKSDEDAEGVSPVKNRFSLGIVGNEADAEQLRCFFCHCTELPVLIWIGMSDGVHWNCKIVSY